MRTILIKGIKVSTVKGSKRSHVTCIICADHVLSSMHLQCVRDMMIPYGTFTLIAFDILMRA